MTKEIQTKTRTPETHEAVYVGRRMTTKHQLKHFWLMVGHTEQKCWNEQIAPAKIGESWLLQFVAGTVNVFTSGEFAPKQLEMQKDEAKTLEWCALDAASFMAYKSNRAEKKLAGRKKEFDKAMEPLKQMSAALDFHDDRAFFIQRVVSELWRR